MSQSFIDALMHFIALLYLPFFDRKETHLEPQLEDYIKKAGILVPPADCLKVFNAYYSKYCRDFLSREILPDTDETILRRQLLIDAARSAQMNLYLRERYLLILALIEYTSFYKDSRLDFINDIKEVASALNITPEEFNEALDFIYETEHEPDSSELIMEDSNEEILEGSWIEQHKPIIDPVQRHIIDNRIKGRLYIKYFEKYHLFVLKYRGAQSLVLNNKEVYPEFFYSFGLNATLIFNKTEYICFDEIAAHFNLKYNLARISITGENITYRYPHSGYTIKPFDFSEDSGQLIGIVGNNGVGKSTILKLIAGINKPHSGDILINGASLSRNRFKLQSAIGYVSQENMYQKEMTVYENLYCHARLCMGDLTSEELKKRTEEVIRKFDLQDVMDIKPADFEIRRVTDFDRICLNIAFELIRDPYILCLDEPLTVLPFADSKRLLNILKEETFEGKIVFISVHLPSPDIYNMFDKVWLIDHGGHMIYQGGGRQALDYFHSSGIIPFRIVSAREDIVSPEDIISLVETKKVRPDGVISDERLVTPETWYNLFSKKQKLVSERQQAEKPLPVKPSSIPGVEKQFFIYLTRLIRIRYSSLKFLFFMFAVIPLAGAIFALVTRHKSVAGYFPGENELLPLFLFLSPLYVFFTGMLNGAEEIMPEKSRIKRDLNLKLSHFSYINAKVVFILSVTVIQTFLFAIICLGILRIEGLLPPFFIIYLSISFLAGLLSLILSAAFRNIIVIYILIPILLIPNLLFSGYLIQYNNQDGFKTYSPLLADLVPGRWAYEALVVTCFTDNKYNRHLFNDELKYYQNSFIKEEILPLLFRGLEECNALLYAEDNIQKLDSCLRVFRNELFYISENEDIAPFMYFNDLSPDTFNETISNELFGYLTYIDFYTESEMNDLDLKRMFRQSEFKHDTDFVNQKLLHHNSAVENIVYGNNIDRGVEITAHNLIKRGKPIYLIPENHFGRSHFFSPYKRVGGQLINTREFNLNALWMMNAILYFVLITGLANWTCNLFRKRKE